MVSSNKIYGVVNSSGEELIEVKYDKIGLDLAQFERNGITNKYILLDSLIPVCQNQKWSFYDVSGVKITNYEFDTIGCITKKTSGTTHNLAVVPECDTIIVGHKKNDKNYYGCMDVKGNIYITGNDAYMQTISGRNKYYIEKNDETIDIVEKYNNEIKPKNNTQTENNTSDNETNGQSNESTNNVIEDTNNTEQENNS